MTLDQASATSRNTSVFWRYWGASATSGVGSAITGVALPLTAIEVLHASPFEVGLVAAAGYVAWIVIGLPAGVIVQRLPLRRTQVMLDLSRALAVGSLPAAWWLGHLTLAHVILTALVLSFATVLFDVGNSTFLPAIVGKQELTNRNSLVSGTHAATQLGGPSLGGLLVQLLGAVPTLLADSVSYLASALLMRTLPERTVPGQRGERMSTLIREGWHFVTRHPLMRPCMASATAANFVSGALIALAPVYLVRELGASPGLVGLLIAADGLGALVGAAITPILSRRLGTARSMVIGGFVGGSMALLMPLGHGTAGMVAFAVGSAGLSAFTVVFSVNTRTHRQVASPPELLPRVMATVRFVSWGVIPIGAVLAGALATATDERMALVVACVLAFADPLILLFSPVRRLRDLGDH